MKLFFSLYSPGAEVSTPDLHPDLELDLEPAGEEEKDEYLVVKSRLNLVLARVQSMLNSGAETSKMVSISI